MSTTQLSNQNMVNKNTEKKKAAKQAGIVEKGERGLRDMIWITCEVPTDSRLAKFWSILVMATILMSTSAFVTLSLPEYYLEPPLAFDIIEKISVAIFTLELGLRCITAPTPAPGGYFEYLKSRLMFFKSIMNLVDLLAILPFPPSKHWLN